LTVTADNQTITFGDPSPTFTASAVGLVNGDTLAGLGLTFAGNATTAVNAGTYTISPVVPASSDYTISLNDGTVTINKANATVAVGFTGTYDGQAHSATGTATGVLNEDLSSELTITGTNSFTNAGTYTVNWTFAGDSNYNAASGTGTVQINKATA